MDKRSAPERLDITSALTHGSPKRSKGERDTPDGYWTTLEPYIKKSSRDHVESLTKDLFRELWKHSGQDVAVAASAPFRKTIAENGNNDSNDNNDSKLQGTWILSNDKGSLTIDDTLECGSLQSLSVDVEELHLESSKSAERLVYVGDADSWEHCHDDFVVTLKIRYNPDDDTINGDIEVSSLRELNPDDYTINGIDVSSLYTPGAIGFAGTREGADDSVDKDG